MEIKKQVIYKDGRYIQISGGGGGAANIVETDELPETGVENTLYLIPGTGGGEGGGGGGWEKVTVHCDSTNTSYDEMDGFAFADTYGIAEKTSKSVAMAVGLNNALTDGRLIQPSEYIESSGAADANVKFSPTNQTLNGKFDNFLASQGAVLFQFAHNDEYEVILEEGFDIDFYFNYGEGGGGGGGGTGGKQSIYYHKWTLDAGDGNELNLYYGSGTPSLDTNIMTAFVSFFTARSILNLPVAFQYEYDETSKGANCRWFEVDSDTYETSYIRVHDAYDATPSTFSLAPFLMASFKDELVEYEDVFVD